MRWIKSGVRSTKAQVEEPTEIQQAEAVLTELRRKHKDIYVNIKEATKMVHTDQTGRFPVTSSRGHRYIMVLIEIDSNYIAMEPMKSRETAEMIRAYRVIMDKLKHNGITPKKQILDNEAPEAYKKTIKEYGLSWELVPPTNQRRLIAERAIQTAKSHVIANLIGCDESYPAREWHRLLPQIELTLNMLRPANVRPSVLAYMYMHGNHNYNKTPLAPLGCKAQCFVGPDNRTSFGEHSIDSWYIGTSTEHYRSHRVFVKETGAERVTDTLVFMHRHITNPIVSKADKITVAAKELTDAIKNNLKDDISKMNMKELE
jgi:hypothetical protein